MDPKEFVQRGIAAQRAIDDLLGLQVERHNRNALAAHVAKLRQLHTWLDRALDKSDGGGAFAEAVGCLESLEVVTRKLEREIELHRLADDADELAECTEHGCPRVQCVAADHECGCTSKPVNGSLELSLCATHAAAVKRVNS